MPAPEKPTILFVPGAWLQCSAYQSFLDVLGKAGYPTRCVEYPSLNPADPLTATLAADATAIRDHTLLPLLDHEKKDVVLVMHSYGGLPGSVAATGLGQAERAPQGKKGVVGLIFVTGFVLPEGATVADGLGGALPPWVRENDVRPPHPHLHPHPHPRARPAPFRSTDQIPPPTAPRRPQHAHRPGHRPRRRRRRRRRPRLLRALAAPRHARLQVPAATRRLDRSGFPRPAGVYRLHRGPGHPEGGPGGYDAVGRAAVDRARIARES